MENLIKFLAVVGVVYCIVSWSIGNPEKANSFVTKVDEMYSATSEFVSETFFDKTKE